MKKVSLRCLLESIPKNVEEICTIQRLTVAESKRTNICKILNI